MRRILNKKKQKKHDLLIRHLFKKQLKKKSLEGKQQKKNAHILPNERAKQTQHKKQKKQKKCFRRRISNGW